MDYSVEDIAKLAKISVRTLHYYDEIGLLSPSYRMSNGRRLYTAEQLIKLMDILFFKKIGFSLKKIKSMIDLGNKDKKALLLAKKQFLEKEIKRIKDLIKSIDTTLKFCYKGENLNNDQIIKQFELFQKTTKEDKKQFEKEFGNFEDEEVRKLKNMSLEEQKEYYENVISKVDREKYYKKVNSVLQRIVQTIENNLKEDSQEVQALMKEYYEIVNTVYPMTKKKWLRIGIAISENKDTYIMYSKIHSKLPEFFSNAIKIYGDNLVE